MSVTEPQATRPPAEAMAGLLALLLASAGRSPGDIARAAERTWEQLFARKLPELIPVDAR